MSPKQLALVIVLFVLVALIAWLGVSGWRAASQARLALADLDRLQAALADPQVAAVPTVAADLAALEAHLVATRSAARPFLWVAPRLGWLPRVGEEAVAAPVLLDMAVEVAGAGRQAVDALAPVTAALAGDASMGAMPQIVAGLAAAAPALAESNARLTQAAALRQQVQGPLHPRLEGLLAQVDQLLPLAQTGLQAAQVAPALLGQDGPRTYLILAQNNHELRPTGGFISGAGFVRLAGGQITELKLTDSYSVDNWQQPHPPAPRPLSEQMGAQLLTLRDSNWSPDFPETADVARALYAQDQGVPTDGVIALDLEAVRLLVGALGPLQIEGVSEPVTGENAIAWMERQWAAPSASEATVESGAAEWWTKRKDFMGELVGAALARLEGGATGGGDLDATALARAVLQMLEGRHLQISVDDPALTKLLIERGWDGGLRPPADSDFLAVVDANVGFNKANAAVQPAIDYRVVEAGGGLVATATITFTHTAPPGKEQVCDRTPRYGESYVEMVQRCYWSYLRIYAPGGSELLETSGLKKPLSETGERGTAVFAGHFVLSPSQQHVVTVRYRLPPDLAQPYRLFVRKQAGTFATPLHVTAGACAWDTDLSRDGTFTCPEPER